MDESCSHCGNMTMAMLRSRYLLARRGGIPLALPRSSSSGRRTTSAQGQGDLRITVRASPSSTSPRASHSSSTSHRLGFPDEYAGSSDRVGPSISFGAPADDGISITASGDELGSGEDDSAALPPSGRVALPESDPELTAGSPRPAYSAKRWRTLPNSSPPHRSRRRRFVTSCPGGPLLSPPHRRLQPLRLLVAEGALLLPPPPLQLGHNSSLHYGRSVELAAGDRRSPPPPLPSP